MRNPTQAALFAPLVLFLAGASGTADAQQALYGVTQVNAGGEADIVRIDVGTGAASLVGSFDFGIGNVSGQMTYDASADELVIVGGPAGADRLYRVDLGQGTITSTLVTGLPDTTPNATGVEWDPGVGRLLVSFSNDGDNSEDRIAELSSIGTALNATAVFTDDMDALGYRSTDGTLVGFDANATTALRVFSVSGLFGAPGTTLLQTPTARGDVGDIAIDENGQLYATGFGGTSGFLVRLEANATYTDFPSYGASRQVVGIAFAPAPPPVPSVGAPGALLLLATVSGTAMLLARRAREA